MKKHLTLGFCVFLLLGCTKYDENYYRLHPVELQLALKKCQNSSSLDCNDLMTIASQVNDLAYQLQTNPQGFGLKILQLQQQLAVTEQQLQNNPKQNNLQQSIRELNQQLAQYLAIVKWLESPEG